MAGDGLSLKAQALLADMSEKGYICPYGEAWNKLWKMLPGRARDDAGGWEPPLPLILAGWYASNDQQKHLRMLEHIEWADRHGVIDKVDNYLRRLPAEQWHRSSNSPFPKGGA